MTKSVFTESYNNFRVMLIEARKLAGFSQVDLSLKLLKPQSFVSKYERGERRLDVVEFLEVARAIGFDPIEFIQKLDNRQLSNRKRHF